MLLLMLGCCMVQLEELKAEVERHQGKHWDHHNCKTEVDIVKASCAALAPCIVPSCNLPSRTVLIRCVKCYERKEKHILR